MAETDVIDEILGVVPGSPLDAVRRGRATARDNSQASFLALFAPDDAGGVALRERLAVAAFVAGLHGDRVVTAFYAGRLEGLAGTVAAEAAAAARPGPYGRFPAGPLSREDAPGPAWQVGAGRQELGPRLSAALEHAQMLVLHPRDASAAALQALLDAGWSTTDIVTLSQLVAFLSFQVRVVAGLRVLKSTMGDA